MAKIGRPVKYKTPEEIERVIERYFLACKINATENYGLLEGLSEEDRKAIQDIDDKVPTVSGLSLALGMTRQGLLEYADKDPFSDTIKKAKQKIESHVEQRLFTNNVAGVIFNLKNNFGWKDKTETDQRFVDGEGNDRELNVTVNRQIMNADNNDK